MTPSPARARGGRGLAAAAADRGGSKLVDRAIDVDHRARGAGNHRPDAAIDRARDESVDERILEPLEARPAEPRPRQQLGPIVAPAVRHREQDRPATPGDHLDERSVLRRGR